jgi:hypothetical protein
MGMLWQTAASGVEWLTHWPTYAAGILYLVISVLPLFLLDSLLSKRSEAEPSGGYAGALLAILFEVLATYAFALTLAPMVFHLSTDPIAMFALPWQLAQASPTTALKILGAMTLIAFCVRILPVVNLMECLTPFALGITALALTARSVALWLPNVQTADISLIPDIVFTLSVLGASIVCYLIVAQMMASAGRKFQWGPLGLSLARPLSSIAAIYPVLLYGAWLGLQFGTRAAH